MHWAEANVVGCVNFSNVLELNPFEKERERERDSNNGQCGNGSKNFLKRQRCRSAGENIAIVSSCMGTFAQALSL